MEKTVMKKKIEFGKIDFCGTGRKNNDVDVEIELRQKEDGKKVLLICGNIWNHIHTDIYCGGQCLDTIYHFKKNNKTFLEVYDLWKKYHLNDMHAGTKKQEDFLKKYHKENNMPYDYTEDCKILEENNLLEDILPNGQKYKYGTGWLYEEIPEEDLQKIYKLLEN